jgi:hypothetical protein
VPEPVIVRAGLGCDDNLCLWVISNNITDNYRVLVRDPQNFGKFTNINNTHGVLKKQLSDGSMSISFRIPVEFQDIYKSRGLDVVLVNIVNGQEAMWSYFFTKP